MWKKVKLELLLLLLVLVVECYCERNSHINQAHGRNAMPPGRSAMPPGRRDKLNSLVKANHENTNINATATSYESSSEYQTSNEYQNLVTENMTSDGNTGYVMSTVLPLLNSTESGNTTDDNNASFFSSIRQKQNDKAHGRNAMPPGRSTMPPGRSAMPPGRSAMPPGRSAMPPGRSAMPPGRRDKLNSHVKANDENTNINATATSYESSSEYQTSNEYQNLVTENMTSDGNTGYVMSTVLPLLNSTESGNTTDDTDASFFSSIRQKQNDTSLFSSIRQKAIESAIESTQRQQDKETEAATEIISARKRQFSYITSTEYTKTVGFTARMQLNALKLIRANNRSEAREEFWEGVMKEHLVRENLDRIQQDQQIPTPQESDRCPFPVIECDPSKRYRSFDGSCNNLKSPYNGRANTAFERALEPDYADDIDTPRAAKSGNKLPNARHISIDIYQDLDITSGCNTVMMMTLGQLVDHDLDKTAPSKLMVNGTLVNFECGQSGCETDELDQTECLPITIPENDPDFHNKTCLKMIRSQEFLRPDCKPGPREQVNSITAWVDASFLYGSSVDQVSQLRDLQLADRGQMRTTKHPYNKDYKPLLPTREESACRDLNDTVRCFLAGDSRENVQPGLTAMHTVFVRLHNYIEEQIHDRNPKMGGELLFQETRKLVIAIWQNIVYSEYVPAVIGPYYTKKFNLHQSSTSAYDNDYDESISGDIINAFATAAFRFGHSQITDNLRFSSSDYKKFTEVPFSTVFFRPTSLYDSPVHNTSGIDAVIFGMISQRSQTTDRFFSKEISVRMFSEKPKQRAPGTDLGAINTQRGRDHGLPSYNQWRKWCQLPIAADFNQLDDIPETTRQRLSDIYEHVDDIDLFTGGISETHVAGGVVGPTFACIIGYQFHKLKAADRFWFEREDYTDTSRSNMGFSREQLDDIRGVTLSKVLCLTLDSVDKIQKYAMLLPLQEAVQHLGVIQRTDVYDFVSLYRGSDNERGTCNQLPGIDFDHWKNWSSSETSKSKRPLNKFSV